MGEPRFGVVPIGDANALLVEHHYLGATRRGVAFGHLSAKDELLDVMVWAKPTSRHLPSDGSWLELTRWCITSDGQMGSRMFAAWLKHLRMEYSTVTTLVSYSDPSAGHDGSLYRACSWRWAPTWQRLRPPPTGNGSWSDGKVQSVKDRWYFPRRPDSRRPEILRVKDSALEKRLDLPVIV